MTAAHKLTEPNGSYITTTVAIELKMVGKASKGKKGGKGGSKGETPPIPPTEQVTKISATPGKDKHALIEQQRRLREYEDKVDRGQVRAELEKVEQEQAIQHHTPRGEQSCASGDASSQRKPRARSVEIQEESHPLGD